MSRVSLTSLACRALEVSLCWSLVWEEKPVIFCMASLMFAHAGIERSHASAVFLSYPFLLSGPHVSSIRTCSMTRPLDNQTCLIVIPLTLPHYMMPLLEFLVDIWIRFWQVSHHLQIHVCRLGPGCCQVR